MRIGGIYNYQLPKNAELFILYLNVVNIKQGIIGRITAQYQHIE